MASAPGITSARIAVALCERFAELQKGSNTSTVRRGHAAPQLGAIGMLAAVPVSHNDEALSMRVSEAQQIYPEIWRHLDDARAAFAGQGVDVSGYDAVRAQEDRHALGVNLEVTETELSSTKTAHFNHAGLARARAAYEAIVQATPHVDWAALAASEANDPAAAAFGQSRRRKLYVSLGVLVLLIAAPFLYVRHLQHKERERYVRSEPAAAPEPVLLPEAERAQLGSTLDTIGAQLPGARAAWPTATAPDALAAITPGTAPCTMPFKGPPSAAADAFVRGDNLDVTALGTQLVEYRAGQPLPDGQLARIERILHEVDRATATAAQRDRVATIGPFVAFVTVDQLTRADVTQTAPNIQYTPGQVTGHGYVFSLAAGKIVCATAIDAHNAADLPQLAKLRRAPDAADALDRELEVAIRRAFASGLHAVP